MATALVAVVSTGIGLKAELSLIKAGSSTRTHIRLTNGTYSELLKLEKPTKVTIIGENVVKLTPPVGNLTASAISITEGVDLSLQSVNATGSGYQGVQCLGKVGSKTNLQILDSLIYENAGFGIGANRCNVTVRRSRVLKNKSGGVTLLNGDFTLVNNLIMENGNSASIVGGLKLEPGSGNKVILVNNTISKNQAGVTAFSAVVCTSMTDVLRNNLLWNPLYKATVPISTGCTFVYSRVPGSTSGVGNFTTKPILLNDYLPYASPKQCPTIDAGSPTNQTVIDMQYTPRPKVKGGKVDVGAFEMK